MASAFCASAAAQSAIARSSVIDFLSIRLPIGFRNYILPGLFQNVKLVYIYSGAFGLKNYICTLFNARMAKLVNVAVSEAVENCLLRVRVSLRAHPFKSKVRSLESSVN